MVLQTERYNNGGYMQQSYSAYQGPTGGYNSYQGVPEYTPSYSGPFQVSTYPLSHGPHHQSGWSTGSDYMVAPVKPTVDGYGSPYYENSYAHGNPHHQSHVNPHGQGYGSPHHQGHGSQHGQNHGSPYGQGQGHGIGKPHGFGGAVTNQINKLTHGHNNYGNNSPNCVPSPTSFNHGYQQPSWTLKGLEMDE